MNNKLDGTENKRNKATGLYELSLTQTINDDHLNPQGIANLAQTLADDELHQVVAGKEILSIVLETLNDNELESKFVDFYIDDNDPGEAFNRLASTQEEPWSQHFDSNNHPDIADDMDNFIPGHYKIDGFICSEHNGHIFSAQDNNLERHVFVKFLKKNLVDHFEATEGFIAEAKCAASVTVPGALPIHSINFTDGGLPYYTLRKYSISLSDIIERSTEQIHPFIQTIQQRIELLLPICLIINEAHDKHIIHGDIKPAHILIQEFGNIHLAGWENSRKEQGDSEVVNPPIGTPMYMSPEQAKKLHCDRLSDIYCLGTSLLHLCTLRFPLFRKDPSEFWEQKQRGELDPFTESERELLTAPLITIIEKCTHKNRQQRYQNMMELHADLVAFLHNDIQSIKALQLQLDPQKIAWIAGGITLLASIALAFMLSLTNSAVKTKGSVWPSQYQDQFASNKTRIPDSSWHAYYRDADKQNQRINIDWNQHATWRIENNALIPQPLSTPNQQNNTIYRNAAIADQFELTFDLIGYRARPQMHVIVNGHDRDLGYTFQLENGTPATITLYKNNSDTALASATIKEGLLKNKTYTCTVRRDKDHLSFHINDKVILQTIDPIPLHGNNHSYIAFQSSSLHTQLRNINIKAPSLTKTIPSLHLADHLYNNGEVEAALNLYNTLRQDYRTHPQYGPTALLRSAYCLQTLGLSKEAIIRFELFLQLYPQQRLSHLAHTALATLYKNSGNTSKAQYHQQHQIQEIDLRNDDIDFITGDEPHE